CRLAAIYMNVNAFGAKLQESRYGEWLRWTCRAVGPRPASRLKPCSDGLDYRVEVERIGFAVYQFGVHPHLEHAAFSRLQLHTVDILSEALQYRLLDVHRPRQVAAGHAVLDLYSGV